MGVYQITSFRGGIADFEDKGIPGAFKFAKNLDIRKFIDSISAGQALVDIGNLFSTSASISPSTSRSPSHSLSPSISPSISPSGSQSPSIGISPSASQSGSPSASHSPSSSYSPSASLSPSTSKSASPSPSSGLHTVFSDLVKFWVPSADGNLYGFGSTGKIYKVTRDHSVYQVYDQREEIMGAAEKTTSGSPIAAAYYGTAYYLVWATNTGLHRKNILSDPSWNDVDAAGVVQGDTWPKNNLLPGDHAMAVVGGDVLIGNFSFLAMYAYDDSYTNEALDLIPGNIVKPLLERMGRAVIGTIRISEQEKGVNALLDTEVPLAQVGDKGEVYYSDFVSSIAVKKLPGGGHVNIGGMANLISQVNIFDWEQSALSWINKQVIGNLALMAFFATDVGYGGVYTAGRRDKNHPFTWNLEYALDADELGAVVAWHGEVYVSYKSGANFGVKVTDSEHKATGYYYGVDFKAPVKLPLNITKWDWAELFFKPLPAGCTIQFWYRVDKKGDYVQAKTANGNSAYSTTGTQKCVFRIGAEGDFFEPLIIVTPYGNDTPEIYRARIGFV